MLEIDVTRALVYLAELRGRTGTHVTLTHLIGRAVAQAITERPDVNAIVRRRSRVYLRDRIDVFFMVAFEGGENLSGTKVEDADRKSVETIAAELEAHTEAIRARRDRGLQRSHRLLERVPASWRGLSLRAIEILMYDFGLDLTPLGVPFDPFGSAMITNVGVFGLPIAFAALVPFSRCPIVLTVGEVVSKPWAVDGRVEARPMVTIGATFDHRLLDGYQAGRLARRFREILADPGATLSPERTAAHRDESEKRSTS